MTEKPRKEQNISEYIAQSIYQSFLESDRDWRASRLRQQLDLQETRRRYRTAWTSFGKNVNRIEAIARSTAILQDTTTVWLLCLLTMVSEALAMMTRETKPTRAEQDELKAKFESLKKDLDMFLAERKKDFDEHLAKRLAKIYDTKGHEALYGASGNE
jgi:hypothetical protein